MSIQRNSGPHVSTGAGYIMPRMRFPHLPHKERLFQGVHPPQSKKTLLTVNQINQFYDSGNSVKHTRYCLWQAGLKPVAFGPRAARRGQPPMLFKAGEALRALEQWDRTDETPVQAWSIPAPETLASVTSELAAVAEMEPEIVEEAQEVAAEMAAEMETPSGPGLPLDAAEITFNAIVDDEACDELMQKISEALAGGAKDIILWISSEGGSLFAALGIYDRLRYLQRAQGVRLHTVATGYVLSAGMILLAAGARRYALPHAIFMLHEPYQMPWESGEEAKVLVTEIHEREELHELSITKIAHIFYERDPRPEKDAEAWQDFFKVPTKRYFGAEEAWQWGLVEEQL